MCCALSDPASFPVRLLSAATRRFAAGLLFCCDPPVRRRSGCLSVSSPGCRLLSGTLHSGAFQFLVPKKRASVAPGPSRTGKGAAAAYRRQWSFGGNGPSAAAAIRWLRPCGDCVAIRPVHLLFRAGAKRDGRAGVPTLVRRVRMCAPTRPFLCGGRKKRGPMPPGVEPLWLG